MVKLEIGGHDTTEIDIQMLAIPELAGTEGLGEQLLPIVEAINAEDLLINARTWKGLHSRFAQMGPMSPFERGLRHFRGFVRERLRSS